MKKKLITFIVLIFVLYISLACCVSCKKKCDKHTGVIECTNCGMNFFDRLVYLIKKNGTERAYANDWYIQKEDMGNTVQLIYNADSDSIELLLLNVIGVDMKNFFLYMFRDNLQFTYKSEFFCFATTSWYGCYEFKGMFYDEEVNHDVLYSFPYSYTTATNYSQIDFGRMSTSVYVSALIHDLDEWISSMDSSLSLSNYGLASFD